MFPVIFIVAGVVIFIFLEIPLVRRETNQQQASAYCISLIFVGLILVFILPKGWHFIGVFINAAGLLGGLVYILTMGRRMKK